MPTHFWSMLDGSEEPELSRPSYLFITSFVPQTPSKILPLGPSQGSSAQRCTWYLNRLWLQLPAEDQPWYPPPLLAGNDNDPRQRVTTSVCLHRITLAQEKWEETSREALETRRVPSHLHFSSAPGVTSGFMQVLLPVRSDYFPWFGPETGNPSLTQLYSLITVTFLCFPKFLMFLSLHNWTFTLQKSITWGSGGRFGKVWVFFFPPTLSFKLKKQGKKSQLWKGMKLH